MVAAGHPLAAEAGMPHLTVGPAPPGRDPGVHGSQMPASGFRRERVARRDHAVLRDNRRPPAPARGLRIVLRGRMRQRCSNTTTLTISCLRVMRTSSGQNYDMIS